MLKFHSLRDKVFNLQNLYAAFKHVKKNNQGRSRPVSIKQFESEKLISEYFCFISQCIAVCAKMQIFC